MTTDTAQTRDLADARALVAQRWAELQDLDLPDPAIRELRLRKYHDALDALLAMSETKTPGRMKQAIADWDMSRPSVRMNLAAWDALTVKADEVDGIIAEREHVLRLMAEALRHCYLNRIPAKTRLQEIDRALAAFDALGLEVK